MLQLVSSKQSPNDEGRREILCGFKYAWRILKAAFSNQSYWLVCATEEKDGGLNIRSSGSIRGVRKQSDVYIVESMRGTIEGSFERILPLCKTEPLKRK
jgi:hypothetical protein